MNDLIKLTPSILTLLGIGGILGSYVSFRLNKSKELEFKKREQKENRYKCALLFMNAYLWPENMRYLSTREAIEYTSHKDVMEGLKAEFYDMTLFASEKVIRMVGEFINQPSEASFSKALLAMRRDLWSKKKDLDVEGFELSLSEKVTNLAILVDSSETKLDRHPQLDWGSSSIRNSL